MKRNLILATPCIGVNMPLSDCASRREYTCDDAAGEAVGEAISLAKDFGVNLDGPNFLVIVTFAQEE